MITQSVFIDGFTQPGARPDGPAPGNDAIILVELDGSSAGPANGLHLMAGSSTLRGLAINRFDGNGILLETGGGNIVQQNFIGTDGAGKQDWGNQGDGIRVVASTDNIIGGPVETDANVIGFNGGAGVAVFQEPPPPPPPPIASLPPGYAGTGYAEGEIAFDFSAPDQFGVQRSLYEFFGRMVVVDLCAINCGPCQLFTEIIPGLQNELDAAGLDIAYLQVLVRELDLTPCTQTEAIQWAADFGLSIPVLQGEQARAIIASWFAHEAPEDRAYPTLLFLPERSP